MKCPECIKEGKKSIVTEGASSMTLVQAMTVWDENGNLMPTHDPNTTTTQYSCSNGHNWSEKT